MWKKEEEWRALEFTTFNMEFTSKQRAEQLISTIARRPSFSTTGAIALTRIVESADDLSAAAHMVAVNTMSGVNREYRLDGNAYWFPLSLRQIDRLVNGNSPEFGQFGTVAQFLDWV